MIESQERKRRRLQFSLRTLFVVVTILAVECAVCLPMLREWEANRKWQERQAEHITSQRGRRTIILEIHSGPLFLPFDGTLWDESACLWPSMKPSAAGR
jgi:hypothetical protein